MGCISNWITPGRTVNINSTKITYISANTQSCMLSLITPWGKSVSGQFILNGTPIIWNNPNNALEYITIKYIDYWNASSGFGIQVNVCYTIESPPPTVTYAKARIDAFDIFKNVGYVGDTFGYSVSVANIGSAGKMHVAVGIGYINDKSLAVFSGNPVYKDITVTPGYKQTLTGNLTITESDLAAQDGTGWAYSPKTLKVFFMAYHYEGTSKVRDDYKMPNFTIAHKYIPPPPVDPIPPRGVIQNRSADLLEIKVGQGVNYSCVIKNEGDTGKITLRVGFGYIDSNNMIVFTGDNHYKSIDINGGQTGTIVGFLNASIEDFYAQEGTGWAYAPKQIRIFFITYADNKNLTIKIAEPKDYDDPTDPFDKPEPEPKPEGKTPWELFLDVIGRIKFKMPAFDLWK